MAERRISVVIIGPDELLDPPLREMVGTILQTRHEIKKWSKDGDGQPDVTVKVRIDIDG